MKKRYYKKRIPIGPLANLRIRAREVRVVDENGQQLGIMSKEKALKLANERNLDLVQVTQKVEPPVCKITDFGKHLYSQKKKEKKTKSKAGGIKSIRLTYGISDHDLETRMKQTEKFLNKEYKVRIEMKLHGREKGMQDFAKEKIRKFLEILKERIPFKIERELIRQPRGLTMIISKL